MSHSFRMGRAVVIGLGVLALGACSSSEDVAPTPAPVMLSTERPDPDPRIGLGAGVGNTAEQAIWNMRLISNTPSQAPFAGVTNSDLAFIGNYAIQGNYNGFQVWDISNPAQPTLRKGYLCPASQSDVSVYRNLLFVSGEGYSGRLDCGTQGVPEPVSRDRLRGLRIFDISDWDNPRYIGNVQTCRGSHTHSLLVPENDPNNVYVYISGSAPVRSSEELEGCSDRMPDEDPNSALFRIEVIQVPLANPAAARIVSSPRIFNDLAAVESHGEAPDDRAAREAQVAAARAAGGFVVTIQGREQALNPRFAGTLLDSIMRARGGTGTPTGADSAALRASVQSIIDRMIGGDDEEHGPTQCHDITLYPAINRAGGACEGYGMLLDISDPRNPRRLSAVSDTNFSYWHSATFNNAGTTILFSDEWGGGGGPKCRASDPYEWGADAIFRIVGNDMQFQSYYKMPAAQTPQENCVAHNGSLIPIPGRDVMVQGWYQGGISVFDFTDPANPVEIAFFDRGPVNATQLAGGGSWSVYWYNGVIVNSEISRGLDILELTPSGYLSQCEIDAANTVELEYFNPQGQPRFEWPASYALACAYLDQLERSGGLDAEDIRGARQVLAEARAEEGADESREDLMNLIDELEEEANRSRDREKAWMLINTLRELAGVDMDR